MMDSSAFGGGREERRGKRGEREAEDSVKDREKTTGALEEAKRERRLGSWLRRAVSSLTYFLHSSVSFKVHFVFVFV